MMTTSQQALDDCDYVKMIVYDQIELEEKFTIKLTTNSMLIVQQPLNQYNQYYNCNCSVNYLLILINYHHYKSNDVNFNL